MVQRTFHFTIALLVLTSLYFAAPVAAQSAAHAVSLPAVTKSASSRGIYLVFPFENAGNSPRLDWLGEGLEELTIQRLSAAGEQVYSHTGRLGELERYGIPSSAKLSRATMLRVAEDLDADFVLFGSFTSDGSTLQVECKVLRTHPASLLPAWRESGSLDSVVELQTRLVWRMLSGSDTAYPLSLVEFGKAQRALRLDAFEHYVRGLIGAEDEARLRDLREAARLEPDWPDPQFALGDVYFARRDCNSALPWYARVPKTHGSYVEALFSTGVCRLLLNEPDRAEETFNALQTLLYGSVGAGVDFPEILNNLAIAKARQNKSPGANADLQRAADLDPDEDDYPFNLGLLAMRSGDFSGAAVLFREASQREPDIPEDRSLLILALEKEGKKDEAEQEKIAATEAFGPNGLPAIRADLGAEAIAKLERLKTELDPETLRFQMETAVSKTSTNATATAGDTTAGHLWKARQESSAGHLGEAEREYRVALAREPGSAAAHLGLAELDRRQGKLDEAVKEYQASLQARDSAVVRTTLARVYLEQKKPALARVEAERALKLAPNYSEAKQVLEHLQNTQPAKAAPKGDTP